MGRIKPAQGNQKLMEVYVPVLRVEVVEHVEEVGKRSEVLRCPIHKPDCWYLP